MDELSGGPAYTPLPLAPLAPPPPAAAAVCMLLVLLVWKLLPPGGCCCSGAADGGGGEVAGVLLQPPRHAPSSLTTLSQPRRHAHSATSLRKASSSAGSSVSTVNSLTATCLHEWGVCWMWEERRDSGKVVVPIASMRGRETALRNNKADAATTLSSNAHKNYKEQPAHNDSAPHPLAPPCGLIHMSKSAPAQQSSKVWLNLCCIVNIQGDGWAAWGPQHATSGHEGLVEAGRGPCDC